MGITVTVNTQPHDLNPQLTRVLIITDHYQNRMEAIARTSNDIEAVVAAGKRTIEFYTFSKNIQAALVRIIRSIHQDRGQHRFSSKLATVVLNDTTYPYPAFVQEMGSNLTSREQSEHPLYS